jgi:hypothetical protein
MVYYIVALHKDGVNEQQVEQLTKTEVLGIGGRMPLGELYSLQDVSIIDSFIIFSTGRQSIVQGGLNRSTHGNDGAIRKARYHS